MEIQNLVALSLLSKLRIYRPNYFLLDIRINSCLCYPDQFLLVLSGSIPACVIPINSCLCYPDQFLLVISGSNPACVVSGSIPTCVISGSIPACVISGSISTCVISGSIPACDIQVNSWMLQYFYHLNCSCRQDRCDPLPAMSVYKNGRTYTED